MMTRKGRKQSFNSEEDIEYFSVVDGVVDVFIFLGGRQPSIAGPLENDGIGVLQTGSPRHSVTSITKLQISYLLKTVAEDTLVTRGYKNNRSDTSGNYGKAERPNVRASAIGHRLKTRLTAIF